MKAMVLTGLKKMELIEIPKPCIIEPSDVLIRMVSVGVCGSDIHYYVHGKIGSYAVEYPFRVGHECAGIVEEVGTGVTRVKPGDRIAIDPAIACWECDQCLAGRHHTCRNLKFLGCPGEAEGCLSEYIIMPEKSCYPLPPTISFDQAVLSEPLSIGVYAVDQSIPMKKAKIGILGSGPIGISVLLSALCSEAGKVYVTDKIDERLKLSKKMGANWIGNPDKINIVQEITKNEPLLLDVVFECCGDQDAMDQAVELLKPGGKLMIIGIPPFDRWSFSSHLLRRKEICIQNVRRQVDTVQKTLDMINNKVIIPDRMITHHFDFVQTKKAFDLVAGYNDGVSKAMIHL
jgi:L-iditol 2-dehydrogenase